MKNAHRYLLATCFAGLLPLSLWAEAPVVDDSENFALLDEQQAANERPVTNNNYYDNDSAQEPALAHETVDTSSNSRAELLNKIQGLQQDIQELRGQLEVTTHDLKLVQQQQLDFYKDLDARIRENPQHVAKNTPPTPTDMTVSPKDTLTPEAINTPSAKPVLQPAIAPSRGNPADEQISYLSAYDHVKNKRYDEALSAMQAFVAQYPQGGYTANAHYWLGELYMVKKNYPNAIGQFEIVLNQFPSSSKSSASLLKIGYALADSGKKEEAKARLLQVVKTYPDTQTAHLATAKLQALGAG